MFQLCYEDYNDLYAAFVHRSNAAVNAANAKRDACHAEVMATLTAAMTPNYDGASHAYHETRHDFERAVKSIGTRSEDASIVTPF